jgi:rod shape-determining protein MreC
VHQAEPALASVEGLLHGRRFLLLSLLLALMMLDHRDQHVDACARLCPSSSTRCACSSTCRSARWDSMRTNFATREALVAENEQLKRDRLNAEVRLQRLAALETRERAAARAARFSTRAVGSRALIAEILAVDLDPYPPAVQLNRGLVDGVYVGQALIDAQGVVGQTVNVGPCTSEAVLITDADHAVPVSVNRNGLRTIAVGTGDSGLLRLPYLTNNADVDKGDLLVSSGLGGVFPAVIRSAASPRSDCGRISRSPSHGGAGVRARSRPRSAARLERGRRCAPRERGGELTRRRAARERADWLRGAEAPSLAKAK